ncbi:hypothetical protein [Vibrio barjaei]|uniref:hypothetical protein n=1 Tax=Vibrio barjaei TaxID=1676683 RepID=UPI0022847E89|nr:hypothetical protein [Vibrio barjaei]MCY9870383.1 hypothetical protein [Vibrio barjaei]
MKEATAQFLADTFDEAKMMDYSGRGMYGRETKAITFSSVSDFLAAIEMSLSFGNDIETFIDMQVLDRHNEDDAALIPWYQHPKYIEVDGIKYDFGLRSESLGYDVVIY